MIRDEKGRVIKKNGKTFRPLDGTEISIESREAYKKAVENQDWEKAHRILFEILTGDEI